jgi:Mechanosensitive ion channel
LTGRDFLATASLATAASVFAPGAAAVPNHQLDRPTVVFQDFILAFCGWFVPMASNDVRVRDWVEIDGVGGEVVQLGLFRTWLLETGNWTAHGHPTGRRVSFLSGYAIRGKYFNLLNRGTVDLG